MKYRLQIQSFILPILLGLLVWFVSKDIPMGIAVFAALLMPAIIRLYVPYAQDNPKHVWFKRKIYGWGWVPVTWQGWLITILYVGLLAAFALTIDETSPAREVAFTFAIPAVLLTIAFIRIAYKKGESPHWQWGVDGK